jgi:hypothetical protein
MVLAHMVTAAVRPAADASFVVRRTVPGARKLVYSLVGHRIEYECCQLGWQGLVPELRKAFNLRE